MQKNFCCFIYSNFTSILFDTQCVDSVCETSYIFLHHNTPFLVSLASLVQDEENKYVDVYYFRKNELEGLKQYRAILFQLMLFPQTLRLPCR